MPRPNVLAAVLLDASALILMAAAVSGATPSHGSTERAAPIIGVPAQAPSAPTASVDDHLYPIDSRVFGSEPSPVIDNDPRITVLLAPIPMLNGYFSSADAYPNVVNSYSNQREMIYTAALPSG